MHVLVTGGAGYIGSHTLVALLDAGHEVIVVDNLVNSSVESLTRVEEITGKSVKFFRGDIREADVLNRAFESTTIDAVVHFAGLKSVGESHLRSMDYFSVNIGGTISLLEAMRRYAVKRLVFSSSATVYGDAAHSPIPETSPLSAANPYGRSKLIVEEILRDVSASLSAWGIAALRYFNPAGAHPSGRIGEDPRGTPNNLIPYVCQVAAGMRPAVQIFGGDYPTKDGTGVRDFIHVMDLAQGHVAALSAIEKTSGYNVWNLGTGRGYSVLEVITRLESVANRPIPYLIAERRSGDAAVSFADPSKAASELEWKSQRGLDEILSDHWKWQSLNPAGYSTIP